MLLALPSATAITLGPVREVTVCQVGNGPPKM
jgi:hypothetical protein